MATPLKGRTVLVTRAERSGDELAVKLRALGAEVLSLPGIEILPPRDWAPLDAAVTALSTFEWLVFTSQNAIEPSSSAWSRTGRRRSP